MAEGRRWGQARAGTSTPKRGGQRGVGGAKARPATGRTARGLAGNRDDDGRAVPRLGRRRGGQRRTGR
jgi:hypothetical protein